MFPSRLADLGAIGAFEESSLLGEDEVGALFCRKQFEGRQRGRDALLAQRYGVGKDDTAVGHDVLVDGVVDDWSAGRNRCAGFEAVTAEVNASDAKIHLEVLNVEGSPLGVPLAFLGWIGESGKDALG